MDMVEKNITARQIVNEKSLRNALACDMALGCSTNTVLHLLAIAKEAGVQVMAYDCDVTPDSMTVRSPVPIRLE